MNLYQKQSVVNKLFNIAMENKRRELIPPLKNQLSLFKINNGVSKKKKKTN